MVKSVPHTALDWYQPLVKSERAAADTLNSNTLFIIKFQGTKRKDMISTLICT